MTKIGPKELQRRALREGKVIAIPFSAFEAMVNETKFDKKAYQRELMRKRRAADKARRGLHP
jgi:hypothetical protein